MPQLSAVLFITDDTQKTGYSRPLMLQNIMGVPALSWLVTSLVSGGCERFFFVCPEKFRAEGVACFPQDIDLTAPETDVSDRLHVFLSTAEGSEKHVTVITTPVMILPKSTKPSFSSAPVASGAYDVDRRAMMDALDSRFSFQDFWQENGTALTDRDGFYAISSPEDLSAWQKICAKDVLVRLQKQGVEIWDDQNTYVEPGVFVGTGSVLLPGTILRRGTVVGRNCTVGPNTYIENSKVDDGCTVNASHLNDCIVGSGTRVGPFANLRPGTVIGQGCTVGSFVEVKNSSVGDDCAVPHLSYLGDTDLGKRTNVGCGTVTANFDRVQKSRTVVGNDCFIGCNATLVAPVTVGDGAYIAAGSTVTESVLPQSLAVARTRQTVKKDWAASHKTKENL